MARKRKPLPLLENITIEAVAAEGKCITRVDDQVIFVPFCVPGDVVDLQVVKKKHKYCEAKVVRFIKKSDARQEPMCEHFGICGGCKWQNLPYEEQIKAKQKQVEDQLTRIGKIELPEFRPIMGSVKTQEYRNKIEFGCSNKRWFTSEELAQLPQKEDDTVTSLKERHAQNAIGFHITGAFDKIYPIKKCWLMDDLCNEIRNFVFEYADSHNYTFYDLREQHGLLRDMMIRNSNTGEWMLVFQFHYDEEGDEQRALELMQQVADKFPQITSLMYVDNQKGNDTINDLDLILFKGNDHIFELMEDLKFKVGPKSFYQTNTEQAYHLYCVAREFANLTGNELVYDLYTGTGTIANFVAHKAKKVIGIEYVPEAIEDAKVNSQVNNIENTLFYAGDMKDILTNDFIAQHGRPDVIITDPPRAGMHPDVVNVILNAAPNRIVYVSCNPATQARDLQLMDDHYKVAAVQPVDMFPHTPHVENVVLLEKRSDAEIKQKKKERREREKAIAEAKAAKEAEKLALEAAKAEDLTAEELAAKAEDLTAEELAAKK
ncbi:23S rRNA (uracil(1939)-C(5))-methyltransferase RlmD [Prevotella copri]|uniref:23S rRNA (Uracil(1939)-C(5))-methyltransferase RlmD n=1 Tax=Segatella copri TaxID=165179 RepID=A0AAW5IGD9_9BACT|nr:23S rRNA (uracil(1939)-C(5))-methyltransferase RlmD [Segatella copri]MCP9534402.1 23S rRNA (uracil(1939)-C(5))-methyltransferase RlmD [Segatella copri]MCP9537339.1 23S rRNA (uracil(1939)-C(5))-methyltransferase RlmD [Segatella copri]MCP9540309.1 23S rRNA (uracil(1939)-C(5))-methyltransferase RlmD [Segatella copri]MCP9558641.1 23S rRNA (uracil(1939)-C(5))-methyltransferase RlmD [Segatella copri]MCP9561446.1 23S rRNA (uracil(1939)-C(5))-methyltransferase RlmD [Segatella copri]